MRASPGPLSGSTTGPGRSVRCTAKFATCRWPARNESSIRNDTSNRLHSWRRGRMSRNPWVTFALFVGLCFAVAAIGSIWTSRSVRTWYVRLQKPSFNPPSWIFGPVWSVLYFSMATSAWLVWRSGGWNTPRTAFILFFVQLGFNLAWSGLFFGLHQPGLAFL